MTGDGSPDIPTFELQPPVSVARWTANRFKQSYPGLAEVLDGDGVVVHRPEHRLGVRAAFFGGYRAARGR